MHCNSVLIFFPECINSIAKKFSRVKKLTQNFKNNKFCFCFIIIIFFLQILSRKKLNIYTPGSEMSYVRVKGVSLIFMINATKSVLFWNQIFFQLNSESSNPGLYRVQLSHLGGSELTNMVEKQEAVCLQVIYCILST